MLPLMLAVMQIISVLFSTTTIDLHCPYFLCVFLMHKQVPPSPQFLSVQPCALPGGGQLMEIHPSIRGFLCHIIQRSEQTQTPGCSERLHQGKGFPLCFPTSPGHLLWQRCSAGAALHPPAPVGTTPDLTLQMPSCVLLGRTLNPLCGRCLSPAVPGGTRADVRVLQIMKVRFSVPYFRDSPALPQAVSQRRIDF